MGAEGSVLKAGPGTVTSAVGAGVLRSTGAWVGAELPDEVVDWLLVTGATEVGCCVGAAAVFAGAVVGLGVGLGVGWGVAVEGGGVGMHDVGSVAHPAHASAGKADTTAITPSSKKPRAQRISPTSVHRKIAVASCGASRVLCSQDL